MTNWKQLPAIALVSCLTPVRTLVHSALLVALFTATLSGPKEAAAGPARGISVNDKSGIEREIFSYFGAFGKGDIDAIMAHYSEDAVFMPAGLPTVAGKANIRAAYVETLKHVRILPGGQSVAEDAFINGPLAWVRTDSRAAVLNPATGQKVDGHFREVFLLRKTNGNWKIWRYMFNMIEPAPAKTEPE